jgi:hypothetical protein
LQILLKINRTLQKGDFMPSDIFGRGWAVGNERRDWLEVEFLSGRQECGKHNFSMAETNR